MVDEPALQTLVDEVVEFLGPFPNVRPLPDGSIAEVHTLIFVKSRFIGDGILFINFDTSFQIPNDLVFGHTKFLKLKSLLIEHFNKFAAKNEDTRAIVFVEVNFCN